MSCSNSKIQNIESLYEEHDHQFKTITAKNIHLYEELVTKLFNFYIKEREKRKLVEFFNKKYAKLQKRPDIIVKKSFIVYVYQKMVNEGKLENDARFWLLIQKSPARNVSGVNSFAVLLSPNPDGQEFTCKHNCYYCPDESVKNGAKHNIARSYLADEPAVARGLQNGWSIPKQLQSRCKSLLMQGHEVDKLELILEGGTYTEYPVGYLKRTAIELFHAANTFYDLEPKRDYLSLDEEKKINMTAKVRIIGICIETRPDAISDEWIKFFRETGTTRIQLGVQHTDDMLLKKVNRGHTFQQAVDCTEYLKNNGFKVDIHLMPDLPGATPEKDKEMFDVVFNTPVLQPDQIKIYPCETVPWTVIKKWYESGKYVPYSDSDPDALVDVIKYAMLNCRPWMRIPRIVRDIPLPYISGGNRCMNMRQVIDNKIKKTEEFSGDIRSREIGRNLEHNIKDAKYMARKYIGSNGVEYFISLESCDKKQVIFGFLRLRIPPKKHEPVYDAIKDTGLVRELHVYNNIVPVGCSKNISTQHCGIGKALLKIAEYVAWLHGLKGVSVITGEGVREYYHKRGYESIETYAIKKFKVVLWEMWWILMWIKYLLISFTWMKYLI